MKLSEQLALIEAKRLPPDWQYGLGLAAVTEYGVRFETGVPVTFTFLRNLEKAPRPLKHLQAQYGQDIEPAGRYMIHASPVVMGAELPGQWIDGEITFRNPIVMVHGGTSSDLGGWKRRLSLAFGVRKAALSKAILAAGFDGIVTVDNGHTSEIVALAQLGR